MNFDQTLAQRFLDALRIDPHVAFLIGHEFLGDLELLKTAKFEDEEYNDLELAELMQADLDRIAVAPVGETWGYLIPRFMGRVVAFLQDFAAENAEWDDEDGEISSESVG